MDDCRQSTKINVVSRCLRGFDPLCMHLHVLPASDLQLKAFQWHSFTCPLNNTSFVIFDLYPGGFACVLWFILLL